MALTKRTRIDKTGRVLIPKELRELASISPGTHLEARYEDGCIILEAASSSMRLERHGRFTIAVREKDTPTLTHDTVEAIRRRLRR